MKRKRGQRGSLRIESGSWYGYFNTYSWDETQEKPVRIRKQKSVKLGPAEGRGKLSKWDAYDLLGKEIEKSTGSNGQARPDASVMFEKFTRERWQPLKEAKWRPSSKKSAEYVLGHIFKAFGSKPLDRIDKIALQNWLNKLATTHSKSLVLHAKFYLKSILEEAVDQEYVLKNHAKKLETPRTKKVAKDTLSAEQFRAVLAQLESPFNLMVQIGVACALRPSELLALRWKDLDVEARTFTIRETVYRGEIRPFTKTTEEGETDQSLLTVPVPDTLVESLLEYRGDTFREGLRYRVVKTEPKVVIDCYVRDNDFIFHNLENGNFLNKENVLFRVFSPVEKKLNLTLNFQVLRRTAATLAQHKGSVKDVQSLLRHRTADISANEYMQAIPESARKMVNSVYDDLTKSEQAVG